MILFGSILFAGCSLLSDQKEKPMAQKETSMDQKQMQKKSEHETFGNSDNVKVVKNPTMMFHDVIVKQTPEGAELEGKVHVRGHQEYTPGHIDIVVVDKTTGQSVSAISTDFNGRIARHGRYNFKHANNIGTRLPGIDPEKSTVIVAYHYSNVDRLSMSDCGANAALASLTQK